MTPSERLGASFRDPGGFVFERDGTLYRQVNASSADDYDLLMGSGLYDALVAKRLLVAHKEIQVPPSEGTCHKVLRPALVPFVNYPYEWSFTQWKRAASATLDVLETALDHGMILKDASAFNLQFLPGAQRPVFIDTLSFERYEEGSPWAGYRQFCRHFLAPLALMAHTDIRLGQWLRIDPDGFPLELASTLLPRRTRWRPGLAIHLHMLARYERRYADTQGTVKKRSMSRRSLLGLIESLRSTVASLRLRGGTTTWGDYYGATNYSDTAFSDKGQRVAGWVAQVRPGLVFDLGANTGAFSRLAAGEGCTVVAFDADELALEQNVAACDEDEDAVLPLRLDLTNPSASIGWANQERHTIPERGRAGLVLALALIHHLAIGNNVPLEQIARYFAGLGTHLVVEFVPKEDSQVRRMLANRPDVFPDYHEAGFREAFAQQYSILDEAPVQDSGRRLFLMRAHAAS